MNSQEKIISDAAIWVIRVEAGLSGAEQDAFLEWYAADPRHSAAYERQQRNWSHLDILADWRPVHAAQPNRDLLAPRRETFFGWLKKHFGVVGGIALGTAAAAAACVALISVEPFQPSGTLDTVPATVYAASDSISTIEQTKLDDGTVVELNRGASITVKYSATERYVRLDQGEVNFQVAKDPTRPFIVNIDGVNVRALGTNFNVRRGSSAVEVLVTSGVVQVDGNETSVTTGPTNDRDDAMVKAGQMAVVSLETRTPGMTVQTVASEKIETMIAWHPRQLDITEQPLSNVVAEFNRRNAPIRLIIADPDLGKTEVSATMRSDQVENFVRLLEGGFKVKAERAGDTVTLRRIVQI